MSNSVRHVFHLVDESPWPIFSALGGISITLGIIKFFYAYECGLALLGISIILIVRLQWWRDVALEGASQGIHSGVVEAGLRWGMALFIISEVFFFLRFFWAHFHLSLSPSGELGMCWPPSGVNPLNSFEVPLLNTLILLSSGARVTWSHFAAVRGDHRSKLLGIRITVGLGAYFRLLQGVEYLEAPFRIAEGAYGSSFFLATGFHGFHVLVGSLFLLACAVRGALSHFSPTHHFGLEAAAWYWHFVDVVWLLLFISIYWWGGIVV